MASVNCYDLDTSGGLMPLIKALIKPPDDDSNGSKSKKPQHPYYKRPGKGHNHDSCDACGEGGDLICCDRCPASFHLGCYDPPLDENDIPTGQWLCRQCKSENKAPSSRGSRAQSPADNKNEVEKKRTLRTRTNSTSKNKTKEEEKNEGEKEKDKQKETDEEKLSPMEILVNAAKIMNPKQFELPREMRIPCPFPGTDKPDTSKTSVVSVDAWGQVPMNGRLCFVCDKTCKSAPLLQCDYCPLLFHLDCLDPPLTALPTGRWMCPNHVEQFIDWKLVNSISATQRVALWDKFSGPVDQQTIKTDFIRKARRIFPPFRVKLPTSVRGRAVIPAMVQSHYENPPPLLPSRREYVRCKLAKKQVQPSEKQEEPEKKQTICMNLDCPKYTNKGACPMEQDDKSDTSETDTDLSEDDMTDVTVPVKRKKVQHPRHMRYRREKVQLKLDNAETEELLAMAEDQLQILDEKLVKLLAWQAVQQIAIGSLRAGTLRGSSMSLRGERALRQSISSVFNQSPRLPSRLLSRQDHDRIAKAVYGPHDARPDHTPILHDDTVDAALLFVDVDNDTTGPSYPMRSSCIRIGIRKDNDVCLASYNCKNIADLHACIYLDQVSNHFELINYSDVGTLVNGVLYSCNIEPGAKEPEGAVATIKQIVNKHQKEYKISGELTGPPVCKCASTPTSTNGSWEGSAVLSHGASIQFGCKQFVFAIVENEDTDSCNED